MPLSRPVTKQDIIDMATKFPDRANPGASGDGCQYFDGNKPSCMFGHIFASLGAMPKDVRRTNDDDEEVGSIQSNLFFFKEWFENDDTLELAACVQSFADDGITWWGSIAEARLRGRW